MMDRQTTDPQVQRLYRMHATQEPSSASDRLILDAARRACEPSRTHSTWRRWILPLSAAATVVVAISIVSQIDLRHTRTSIDQVANSDSAKSERIDPPPLASQTGVDGQGSAGIAAKVSADRSGERKLAATAAAPASAPVPVESTHAFGTSQERATSAFPTPSDWIERIRALRKEGKEAESARQLEEFRAAYPGYVLPEDLSRH